MKDDHREMNALSMTKPLLAAILFFLLAGCAAQTVMVKKEAPVAEKQRQQEKRETPIRPDMEVPPASPVQSEPSAKAAAPAGSQFTGTKIADVPLQLIPLDLMRPPTTEEIMAAGQLGGQLYPTHSLADTERANAVNLSFGIAMQEWNKHEYKKAVQLLQEHVATYPDSPWKAEAVLHIGCDSQYNGRYSEAEKSFTSIIEEQKGSATYGGYRLANKATLRLGVLKVFQNNFSKAGELFGSLIKTSDDWREKTYASHWLQRITMMSGDKLAVLNCGTLALARVLEKDGKEADARKVREMPARTLSGQSMSELQEIAAAYGYEFNTLRIPVSELVRVPLPAIVQLPARSASDSGHYWVFEERSKEALNFFDPQAGRWFTQRPDEFAREWDGNIMVLTKSGITFDSQYLLSGDEAGKTFGGCCGAPRAPDNLGPPDNPCRGLCCGSGGSGGSSGPGSGTTSPNAVAGVRGAPTWTVNKINMNLFLADTPLWYSPPIGPPVNISVSYNSQASIAYHQPFGQKWQFNYSSYLIVDTGGQVTVFMPDGRNDVYSPDGASGYTSPYGVFNKLVRIEENHYTLDLPDGTVYEYAIPSGTQSMQPFLVKISDRFGQALTLGYDSSVHLTTITDALGQITTVVYNTNGNATEVYDPFGRQALFEYDVNGNLIKITDMGGYWASFTYDANVYLTSLGDQRSTWQFYIEPADGIFANADNYPPPGDAMFANYRVTVMNPLGGREEFFFYGGCGAGFTCAGGGWYVSPRHYVAWEDGQINNMWGGNPKILYDYLRTGPGRINKIIHPDDGTELYEFDPANGKPTRYSDQHGHVTNYEINSRGRITRIIDPRGTETAYDYAQNGLDLTGIANGLGTVTIAYDDSRNMRMVTDRLGKTTTFTYNEFGQRTSIAEPDGRVTTLVYYGPSHQSRYRLKQVERGGLVIAAYAYDAIGRRTKRTDDAGLTLQYAYDNLNRITSITYPDARQERMTYVAWHPWLMETITDRGGAITRYEYDPLKRLAAIYHPDGSAVRYEYDANGNIIRLTDENNKTTSFAYDVTDRLTRRTFADGTFETYTYDRAGLRTKRTDGRGIVTSYRYDGNHNHVQTEYSDGITSTVTRTYDAFNRIIFREDGSGTTSFGYDAESRLTRLDGPWGNDTVDVSYDDAGRLTGIAHQAGEAVGYTYDALGRLMTIAAGARSFSYVYPPGSSSPLPASLARPNGSYTEYVRDGLTRLTGITDRSSSGQIITAHAFTYNAQDQRATETVMNGPAMPAPSGGVIDSQYNALNQLLSSSNPERLFLYDADGNMTRGYTPEGYQFTAGYDGEKRLTSVAYTDNASLQHQTTYAYGGDDFMTKQTVDGQETRYVRFGYLPLQERNGANATTRSYVWNPFSPGGIGGLLEMTQGGQQYAYTYDGRGNVRGLLDSGQTVVASYLHDPFGVLQAKLGTVDQPFKFSTKACNDTSGLVYYGYRFYSAMLGRWLTRDPLREQGDVNLYAFVDNDPLNSVDILGLQSSDGSNGFDFSGQDPGPPMHFRFCNGSCPNNHWFKNFIGRLWMNLISCFGNPDFIPDDYTGPAAGPGVRG